MKKDTSNRKFRDNRRTMNEEEASRMHDRNKRTATRNSARRDMRASSFRYAGSMLHCWPLPD